MASVTQGAMTPAIEHSCLYQCHIAHTRSTPKRHHFFIQAFWFAIDLDELPAISNTIAGFGRQWWQPYAWKDSDHMPFAEGETAKARVINYLNHQGIENTIDRVVFIGQPRVLGYSYNPASFYLCWDDTNQPVAALLLVDNTFRELKAYTLPYCDKSKRFSAQQPKDFYVSPFLNIDDVFESVVSLPDGQLTIEINTVRDQQTLLHSRVTGQRIPLTSKNVWRLTCWFPFYPQLTMLAIHWQALQLWRKGIAFHNKEDNPQAQRPNSLPNQRKYPKVAA